MSSQASTGRPGEHRDTHGRGHEAAQGVKEAAREAKGALQDQMENIRDTASQYLERGQEKAQEISQSLESQITEKPLQSVLLALGIGFVLGVFWIRR